MALAQPVGRVAVQTRRAGAAAVGGRLGELRLLALESADTISTLPHNGSAPPAGWRVVAASVQGTAHQKQDLPCQDAHTYRVLPDGTLLVAVADGAGSAARADEGARLAVQSAIAALETAPLTDDGQTMLRDAFAHARAQLLALAAQHDVPPSQFATTLTCALATADALTVGRIGDGAVVVEYEDQTLMASAPPQRGEYTNETYFLTMDDALDQLELQTITQPVHAIAITTDGLIRLALKLPDYTPHAPFFQPLLAFAADVSDEQSANEQLAAFLASERVCARTDDDKTLVLAVRVLEPAPIGAELPVPLAQPETAGAA